MFACIGDAAVMALGLMLARFGRIAAGHAPQLIGYLKKIRKLRVMEENEGWTEGEP